VTDLQAVLAEKNAKLSQAGDRIQELEALLNERNAELTEARLLTEMLVGADRQWRQRERLLEMELERLRGDRGMNA
jgi:hypothetical protein